MIRVGIGYDIHRLEEGYPCWLGGVLIPHHQGLVGYSDGDSLLHAVCDALLGAAGLGDMGRYFPEGDPRWKNVASITFLEDVARRLLQGQYRIVNIDAVVIAERPRIAPYVDEMKLTMSRCLSLTPDCVNIKATTNEKLGAIGREEGIAAHAVCLIEHD